jgi:hypothetical protein
MIAQFLIVLDDKLLFSHSSLLKTMQDKCKGNDQSRYYLSLDSVFY